MGDRATLIATTRLGVRPLGVRGEPLHGVAGQLRAVIRRRLGEGPASLLAEPQLREDGSGIDWYADHEGPVRALADLDPARRAEVLAEVAGHLAAIEGLGRQLADEGAADEARLVGRSLQLATVRPSDDFIWLVGERPVIVAWGYEPDQLASLTGANLPSVPVPAPPPAPAATFASAPAAAIPVAGWGWAEWLRALLVGLLLLLLLLLASWLMRGCAPVEPGLNVAAEQQAAPPAPPAPPDPTPLLKASLDAAQADLPRLRAELAALEADLKTKLDACKPIEPPKPPPPPPPPPKPEAKAPPVTQPPAGQLPCNWAGDSGGEGVTRNRHYLGDKPGFVALQYQNFARPDDIKVFYRGQQIAGTGGPRSGGGGFGFDWKPVGGDFSVDVVVTGEMFGTRWNYMISCPR